MSLNRCDETKTNYTKNMMNMKNSDIHREKNNYGLQWNVDNFKFFHFEHA